MIVDTNDIRSTISQVVEYLCNIAETQQRDRDVLAMGETINLRDRLIYCSSILENIQKQLDKENPPIYKVDDALFKKLLRQRIKASGRLFIDALMKDIVDCTIFVDPSE